MRITFWVVGLAMLGLLACASGGSDADCETYCDVMNQVQSINAKTGAAGTCFDNWICIYVDTYENNLCQARTLLEAKTTGANDVAQCFRSWNEAPQLVIDLFFDKTGQMKSPVCVASLSDLSAVSCATTGSVLLNYGTINNPSTVDSCKEFCKATAHGSGMSGEVAKEVEWARKTGECGDFLQAELTQQCQSSAQEQ